MTNKAPLVSVPARYSPVQVSWQRLTSSNEETGEWHTVVIRRYKTDGQVMVPGEFFKVTTAEAAVKCASEHNPPRVLTEGTWSNPIVQFL